MDECVFSADAMGLRPLWKLETPQDFVFSSEPGVVSVAEMISEPQPMAPGQKYMVLIDRERKRSTLHPHAEMLAEVRKRWLRRTRRRARSRPYDRALETGGPLEGPEIPGYTDAGPEEPVKVEDRVLAGFGWQRDDVKLVQQMADNGAEPIGSLGLRRPPRRTLARSARTSPTTSRRPSPSSPTRRSTASARSSTSRRAPSSAAARR